MVSAIAGLPEPAFKRQRVDSQADTDLLSTELIAGILGDLRHDYRAVNLELKRRLSDNWLMRLEAFAILSADPEDLTCDGRRDSYLGAEFMFSF